MWSTSLCRGRSDRSSLLRTAPARERRPVAVGGAYVRHGYELLDGRADEQPLICARPVEQEPASVRRPGDVRELTFTAEGPSCRASEDARQQKRAAAPARLDECDSLAVRRDGGRANPGVTAVEPS